MPRISSFQGIVILMFSNEGAHAVPHFHARYAEHKASIGFDGALIAGAWKQLIPSPNLLTMADAPPLVDITGVAVIGDHKLRLLFEDGTVGDISF